MTAKTDRELLELAAKAAGIERDWNVTPRTNVGGPQPAMAGSGATWNPLTDDGDALRLAVRLSLLVDVMGGKTEALYASGTFSVFMEAHGGDPYAATRRAIVRAAAAMGGTL